MTKRFFNKKSKPAKTRIVNIEEIEEERKKKQQKKKEKKRKNLKLKRFFKISAISFGVFILLIGIALGLAARHEDDIKVAIIKALNKNMTTDVAIGQIDLDIIRSFPNASIDLHGVVIPGKFGGSLLRTELISFSFHDSGTSTLNLDTVTSRPPVFTLGPDRTTANTLVFL